MDIVELTSEGLKKVGTWNSTEGVNISRPTITDLEGEGESLHNKSFVVLTSLVSRLSFLLFLKIFFFFFKIFFRPILTGC